MKFESKISGTKVTDYNIKKKLFSSELISLDECIKKIKRQETMDFLLDTFRFTLGEGGKWYAIINYDTILKASILEYYPEYEKEMKEYFGDDWLKFYIRFNH